MEFLVLVLWCIYSIYIYISDLKLRDCVRNA